MHANLTSHRDSHVSVTWMTEAWGQAAEHKASRPGTYRPSASLTCVPQDILAMQGCHPRQADYYIPKLAKDTDVCQ